MIDAKQKPKKARATICARPIDTLPAPTPDNAATMGVLPNILMPQSDDGGQKLYDTHHYDSSIIGQIRELQAQRVITIRAIGRITNAAKAYTRRRLGFEWDATEKVRNAVNKKASAIVDAILKDKPPPKGLEEVYCDVMPIVTVMKGSLAPQEAFKKALEKAMAKLAKQIPASEWYCGQHGLAIGGFANIVGEAGDIGNYANPAKLWKRMGLGVFYGHAQRKSVDKAKAEEMGYNPRRRSVMWNIGAAIIRAGKGPYRDIYDERKLYEVETLAKMTLADLEKAAKFEASKKKSVEEYVKNHAHKRAQRYAEKRVLRDLWRAWNHTKNDTQNGV